MSDPKVAKMTGLQTLQQLKNLEKQTEPINLAQLKSKSNSTGLNSTAMAQKEIKHSNQTMI